MNGGLFGVCGAATGNAPQSYVAGIPCIGTSSSARALIWSSFRTVGRSARSVRERRPDHTAGSGPARDRLDRKPSTRRKSHAICSADWIVSIRSMAACWLT